MTMWQREVVEEKQKVVEVSKNTPLLDLKLPMYTKVVCRQDLPSLEGAPSSSSRPPDAEETRSSPTTRPNTAGDEEHSSKKAKMSLAKKLRIDRVTEEMASCIRVVKIGGEELYTIDEPDADPLEHNTLDELYEHGREVPECLWSDGSIDEKPPEPERWIDKAA